MSQGWAREHAGAFADPPWHIDAVRGDQFIDTQAIREDIVR